MKRTLFLTLALASVASAAAYTDLSKDLADSANNVYYSKEGYFAVTSNTNSTSVDLVIDWEKLKSMGSGTLETLLVWDTDYVNYGLCVKDGSIYGYINNTAFSDNNNVPYDISGLESYAVDGKVTLRITNGYNSNSTYGEGVKISVVSVADAGDGDVSETVTQVSSFAGLKSSGISYHTGYYVNTDAVSAVTLNTAATSSLDMSKVTQYNSNRTDGSSIGRTMFVGDSITHGYADRSYRWALFKILTDNGIENEVVGPRNGHHSFSASESDYASSSYGGSDFVNEHLAEASGRTHNVVEGSICYTDPSSSTWSSGVKYSGMSSYRTGLLYDCNTYVCLLGTNDLLSDNNTDAPASDYCNDMQKMLGGEVSYADGTWSWTKDSSYLGTMGTIASDLMNSDNDKYYVLSIPTWSDNNSKHGTNDTMRDAVKQYNAMLQEWVNHWNTDTSDATIGTMKFVDINRGLVDVTADKFISPDVFFNAGDGLHPSVQGSLIIAGNLAREMGIGGRTAGLERADIATSGVNWSAAEESINITADQTQTIASSVFSEVEGYTVDFSASFGDGEVNDWASVDAASLSVTIGDGIRTGTLTLSEGYIMWGDSVLFCWDNSTLSGEGNLRIAWHNGNAADNVMDGYYVWLGDMLIGQALDATAGTLNGITLSAKGSAATIADLIYTDKAYAPTTERRYSSSYAYVTTQDAPPMPSHDNTPSSSGVSFADAAAKSLSGKKLYNETSVTKAVVSSESWIGLVGDGVTSDVDVSVQVVDSVTNTVFGAMGTAKAGDLLVQVDGGTISGGNYNSQYAAIAGSHGGGCAESFTVYVNSGKVGNGENHDIVGGAINESGKIGAVKIVINGGEVKNIYGGSKTAGTVGEADIIVNGGKITGDIVACGTAGTIGNTDVVIHGGVITGDIRKGDATQQDGTSATVSVIGNKASIGGSITADKVTLKDVSVSGYSDGFDRYNGTITAPVVVLDNVKNNILATLEQLESLTVINETVTELTMGETLALDALELGADTSLGLFKTTDDHTVSTATETTLTISGVLTVSGSGATLNANLVMGAGSELKLAGNSLQLGSSLTLGGVQLDDVTIDKVTALAAGTSLTLFTEVDELILGNESYTEATSTAASTAFANTELAEGYRLVYSGADAGGEVRIMAVPEPASTTLSLLALAALAARRRRK